MYVLCQHGWSRRIDMIRLCRLFVAIALLGGLLPAASRAEESADSTAAERAVNLRFAELEAEIAALRQQMNGAAQGPTLAGGCDYGAPCGYQPCCDACCDCCCDCCCEQQCRGHWYA